MSWLKRWLKNIFYSTGNAPVLDRIIFQWSQLKYGPANKRYRNNHPEITLPPVYYLYETYIPDYEKYIEDGLVAAKEILEWTGAYRQHESENILEWGCGVSRIVRHLPSLMPATANISACDINAGMIEWNKLHIPAVQYSTIGHQPPTHYNDEQFSLVYAISVFTNIEGKEHLAWIKEIHRVLSSGGVFLFTTHGENYAGQLTQEEKKQLHLTGYYTRSYPHKGHRMMTSYNDANRFRAMAGDYFEVVEFHDGKKDPGRIGGQDLWILRKKLHGG